MPELSGLFCAVESCNGELAFSNPNVGECNVCHNMVVFNKRSSSEVITPKRTLRKTQPMGQQQIYRRIR